MLAKVQSLGVSPIPAIFLVVAIALIGYEAVRINIC